MQVVKRKPVGTFKKTSARQGILKAELDEAVFGGKDGWELCGEECGNRSDV